MNRSDRRWVILLSVTMVVLAAIIYAVNFAIFRDGRNLVFYLLLDLAFLPIEVLIVGVIVERVISRREKRSLEHKMNMVIGTFFSEMGTELLTLLLPAVKDAPQIREQLHLQPSWKKEDFARAHQFATQVKCDVDVDLIDLEALRSYLVEQRHFLLRLLENPNLLEHERFTDILWAVLHVEQELEARPSLTGLAGGDKAHLALDIRRAYALLLDEWLFYTQHLKGDYPYLFSLVCRVHPFQDSPSATIEADEQVAAQGASGGAN
jgi:hypothetical protein